MLHPQTSGSQVSIQEHPQLLALLQDDSFREELKARPMEALSRCGIDISVGDVPSAVELPELRAADGIEPVWLGLL